MRAFVFVVPLYALTLALGIVAAARHLAGAEIPIVIPQFTVQDAITFAVVFILATVFILRFGRAAHFSLGILLTLAILVGGMFVFGAWLPWPLDLAAAIALVAMIRIRPLVGPHDLGIVVGIAGVSGLLGLALTPLWAVGLLAVLSVYDIVSVYHTRHMVALAGRMLESGAVFGFLIPNRLRTFGHPVEAAIKERSVMVLGSGDIGLPLVLATSSVATSVNAAFMVAGASLVGLMVMQWLFVHQRRSMPMAALPPIAVSAILGYALAIALGI